MVKLRLTRIGRKKQPYYRIIAVDSRKKRDGTFLDRIGYYHPLEDPAGIKIDADKALKWLRVGAQPTNTVRSLLRRQGVWYRFLLEKRKLPEAQIETLMSEWMTSHASSAMAESTAATKKVTGEPETTEAAPEKAAETAEDTKVEEAAEEVKADDNADQTELETVDEPKAETTAESTDEPKPDVTDDAPKE